MTNPELSYIKIETSFCLHKNTFSSARGWGDIWRKEQVSPFIRVGPAPTFPVWEFVPLLWYGPTLRKARFGGEVGPCFCWFNQLCTPGSMQVSLGHRGEWKAWFVWRA